ncbi:MAG TPA: multicopper oxidase family protein [Salinarimonas sp.]|nr:multicopper oxidase family protein [Salinarimonas sp.]
MPTPTRRAILAGAAALAAGRGLPARAASTVRHRLVLAPGEANLVAPDGPPTPVWTFGGTVPGPILRARQGDRLVVEVENHLPVDTTVHWHGLRLPHAMDGVPHVTQDPIPARGGRFVYAFDLPDAGTFWYHPHLSSAEAVGRGLAGALVVEERAPLPVDRDLVWVLQDWRVTREAALAPFGGFHDAAHAGRLGQVVTLNGSSAETVAVRAGERLRLRLVNASSARIYALAFRDHAPVVIATDGHPVEPHAPEDGRVVLAPGQRVDLLLDCLGEPRSVAAVVDHGNPRFAYGLVNLAYESEAIREEMLPLAPLLPANPLPEPDPAADEVLELRLAGGAMGGLTREMAGRGIAWTLNGHAAEGHHAHPVLATLVSGRSYRMRIVNDTAWPHPMHLHGHVFRVLSRNGAAPFRREWRDTVLLDARGRAEIAFVAGPPGDWMVHCHILDHHGAGMAGILRVA